MPLTAAWLPMATPLDPAEEPPGSLDPLGTLNYAERLAEVLLPAFTVRMWRARLLTFAVVAATVADRAVARMEGREDIRLEARLAFERLFVSAMVRLSAKEPEKYGGALPRLPGRDLANKAWLAGEPLTPANFLKGQAVNGPFGVIARLARQVELVDADGCVGRNATSLLIAWSEDEQISGVLDEDGASTRAGAGWMNDAVKTTIACVSKREWPGASHRIWEQLAMHLRPDQIGLRERRALLQMLEVVPVRRRLFWILKNRVDLFLDSRQLSDRGRLERAILLDGVRPELGKDPVDCLIADVIAAADTYEQTTSLLQQAFDGLIWSLKNRGGRATPKAVLSDERLCKYLERTRLALSKTVPRLCQTMNLLRNQPLLDTAGFVEPLARLHEEVVSAEKSEASLAQVVLSRHGRVQREKAKAPWIESEAYWTLMPGENRISGDVLPVWSDKYLHPFKISNAYRRNREIASVIDFYNHETSAPRKLILDATSFVRDVSGFVRASGAAVERFRQAVEGARSRIRDWRSMPADFKLRETPRAIFVGGLPRRKGGMAQSPLDQLINQWGNRRAEEITVMTPFVGDLEGPVDPVVERLMQLPRARGAAGYLVVPGQPSERDSTRMVVGLPRRFLVAWASAWRRDPNAVDTYVVPLCRQGEKANRDLHAKGVLVAGDGMEMLLCGSSNFSPRGMGIGVANAEANLCYTDDSSTKRNGLLLKDRLPVDWNLDFCESPIWPEMANPIEDEQPGTNQAIPAAFLWAVYNQRTAVLIIAMDTQAPLPVEWSVRWPGEGSERTPPLLDDQALPQTPPDGRAVVQLSTSLRGANIAGLRLSWRDETGVMKSGLMPVHVEATEDLLPPDEFRSLSASGIVECLLSGREPAEWIAFMEGRQLGDRGGSASREFESLRAVDTSSYLLYRTRRLGAALTAQGERLLRTTRTQEALNYRLRQDPLGPLMLAEALIRESEAAALNNGNHEGDGSVLLFSLAEVNLMLAHVARRLVEVRFRVLFQETIEQIDRMSDEWVTRAAPSANLSGYLMAVRTRCTDLLPVAGGGNAG